MFFYSSGVVFAWKRETRGGNFKNIQFFFRKTGGIDPANFRDVCMEDIAALENTVQADIFLYDIDLVDGSLIGEPARRRFRKHSNTVRLLNFNRHICYISNINALFEACRCPSCDQFIKMVFDLERELTTCKEIVEHVFPKKMYQLRETMFNRVNSFNIP